MAYEPINIFSRQINPRGVVQAARALGLEVQVTGADDDWQQLTILGPKKLLRTRLSLTLTHDSESYEEPDWSVNMAGMRNYFAGFPDAPRKAEVLKLIPHFRFILAIPEDNLDIDSNDERLNWLSAVCQAVDGVFFTPSTLRDASRRILLGAAGDTDPAAALPQLAPVRVIENEEEQENEEYEEAPPTADRVAARTLVLAAVAYRGFLEMESDRRKMEGLRTDLLTWIEETGIAEEVEPDEWEILQVPVGTLPVQSTLDAIWRVEGLGVCAWALKLYEPPPYDELVTPADLWPALCMLDETGARGLISNAELRTPEELSERNANLLAFNWRMVDFRVRPVPMDFEAFSKKCWFGSFDISFFRTINKDLAIGDSAISEADKEELGKCMSSARERHQAINWLCGQHRLYSQVDTST